MEKLSQALSLCLPGHQQNPVYALYRELQKVSSFVEVLKTDGDLESVFPDRDGPGGNAVKQLRELFTNKKVLKP